MRDKRLWSSAAKLLTVSVILLLIAVGLCAAGGGFDTRLSQFQVGMSYVGALLALVAFFLFLKACAEVGRRRKS